jgi:hypothetical protein
MKFSLATAIGSDEEITLLSQQIRSQIASRRLRVARSHATNRSVGRSRESSCRHPSVPRSLFRLRLRPGGQSAYRI